MADHDYTDFHHEGEPALEDLFNKTRINRPVTFKTHWKFFLWIPVGVVLGCIRFITLFALGMPIFTFCALFGDKGEKFFWKYISVFFCFHTRVTNPEMLAKASEAPVLTCNHVSDYDGIAFFGVVNPRNAVMIVGVFLYPLIKWASILKWKVKCIVRQTDPARKNETRDEIVNYFKTEESRNRQLFVLAEGCTSNGSVGLLQYNRFCFSLRMPVQPFALRLNTHLPIVIDKPSKNFSENLFFMLFCPWVDFNFTALPVQTPQADESPEAFAERVQRLTADSLGIACTTYNYKHKNKWRKVVR